MSTQQLSSRLESAAYAALSALAGVDTHDVNLCDHPKAWAAIEAFAAVARAEALDSLAAEVDAEIQVMIDAGLGQK